MLRFDVYIRVLLRKPVRLFIRFVVFLNVFAANQMLYLLYKTKLWLYLTAYKNKFTSLFKNKTRKTLTIN